MSGEADVLVPAYLAHAALAGEDEAAMAARHAPYPSFGEALVQLPLPRQPREHLVERRGPCHRL